jgi:hypothetical protein
MKLLRINQRNLLYICEYRHLSDEYNLSVYENRVLRRVSGTCKEEVAGGLTILCKDDLQNLHTSPKVRVMNFRG